MLADRFGAERAAWIARALTPTNPRPLDRARRRRRRRFLDLGDPATSDAHARKSGCCRIAGLRRRTPSGAVVAVVHRTRHRPRTWRSVPTSSAAVTIDDEQPAIDDGMRWMVDFDAAEEVGMALRITAARAAAVDVLLVTGVAAEISPTAVHAQLDAHRYTDGLAFMPPARPRTTPRPDAPVPGARSAAGQEFRSRVACPLRGRGQQRGRCDASLRRDGVHAPCRGRRQDDDAAARAMATALWPATWGYFLSQMIGFDGTGLTVAGTRLGSDACAAHLRPGGPLPVLRCRPPAVWRAAGHLARRLDPADRHGRGEIA